MMFSKANNIPKELKERRQWMQWFYGDDGNKIPAGKSNDPTTWCGFDELRGDKIAYTISADDDYVGIDLDGCVDDHGSYTTWASEIIQRFHGVAYCETSPSGKGVKLLTRAKKPQGMQCLKKIGDNKQQIEVYEHGRFWTITGQCIGGGYFRIEDGQEAVNWLHETHFQKTETPATNFSQHAPVERHFGDCPLMHRARVYAAKFEPVGEGQRNNAAFRNAGHLYAFEGEFGERLSDDEVLELMREWNARNANPISDSELVRTVLSSKVNGTPPPPKTSTATKTPDISFIEKQANESRSDKQQTKPSIPKIQPISIGQLVADYQHLRPEIISGVLRRGETANIIASPKIGKSFLGGNLAWSIAAGVPWLSHEVQQGRVLIIDNELHRETIASRLSSIANGMQVTFEKYSDAIDVIPLRGQNIDIHGLEGRLQSIEPGTYELVILDALYRTIPVGTSENDNAAMMAIYNKLDYYAFLWDCAVAVVHHSSKGQQGDKGVTDVGAGAGAISRAADTHIVIRPHEDPELAVLEMVTRSFKSPPPQSIRFEYPVWSAESAEPQVKRLGSKQAERQQKDDEEADRLLLEALEKNTKWLSASQLERSTGMGPGRVKRAVGRAMAADRLELRTVKRQGRRVEVYRPSATATATA